jgi:hypothetical protein
MGNVAKKDELEQLLSEKLGKYYLKIVGALDSAEFSKRKWLKFLELRRLLPLSDYRYTEIRMRGLLDFEKVGRTYYYTIESIRRLLEEKVNHENKI